MPEIQEVFRMATQKVRPDPEALDRQHRGQRRRVAQKRAAVYALVALLLVAGAVIGISTLGNDDVQPAGSGSNPPPPQAGEQTLSIVDVGTGTATAFTAPSEASGFDFTLDGSMVTFAGLDDHGKAQVFVADADGSNARQLTHGEGGARGPRWSPDDSMIAYEREPRATVRSSSSTSRTVRRLRSRTNREGRSIPVAGRRTEARSSSRPSTHPSINTLPSPSISRRGRRRRSFRMGASPRCLPTGLGSPSTPT